tara:strand:+ start:334 stop:525 length:192 start_codon:yes stop_codon:yes gene_type:complete
MKKDKFDLWREIEKSMTKEELQEFYKDKPKKNNPIYKNLYKQKMEALDKVVASALRLKILGDE